MKKAIQVFAILLVILTMSACSKKSDSNHKVGDTYQGGIIFYILKKGDAGYDSKVTHGLIASTEDQSGSAVWDTTDWGDGSVPGTLTTFGSGSANTDKIFAKYGTGRWPYAAGIARAYKGGGYTDWYLPSLDELDELHKHKDSVGGFVNHYYWSSSEIDTDTAWGESFLAGKGGADFQLFGYKNVGRNVRAIRSF